MRQRVQQTRASSVECFISHRFINSPHFLAFHVVLSYSSPTRQTLPRTIVLILDLADRRYVSLLDHGLGHDIIKIVRTVP